MKYPPYAVFNLIVISINIIMSFLFMYKNNKYRNVELLREMRENAFGYLIIELIFFVAVHGWLFSGMDAIAWAEDWQSQLTYIIAENLKSLFFVYKLITYWRRLENGER